MAENSSFAATLVSADGNAEIKRIPAPLPEAALTVRLALAEANWAPGDIPEEVQYEGRVFILDTDTKALTFREDAQRRVHGTRRSLPPCARCNRSAEMLYAPAIPRRLDVPTGYVAFYCYDCYPLQLDGK